MRENSSQVRFSATGTGTNFLFSAMSCRMRFFCASLSWITLPMRIERRLDTPSVACSRHQQHAIVAPVVGQLDAEAVEDAAARRRDQPLGDAVVFGLGHVFVAVEDLELVEPPAQHREHRRHAAAQPQRAAGEGGVAAFVLVVEQRHQKSLRERPDQAAMQRRSTTQDAGNIEQHGHGQFAPRSAPSGGKRQ